MVTDPEVFGWDFRLDPRSRYEHELHLAMKEIHDRIFRRFEEDFLNAKRIAKDGTAWTTTDST